jgi:hypothetical protein
VILSQPKGEFSHPFKNTNVPASCLQFAFPSLFLLEKFNLFFFSPAHCIQRFINEPSQMVTRAYMMERKIETIFMSFKIKSEDNI